MTTLEIIGTIFVYSAAMAALIYFLRPNSRRIAGAVVGGIASACVMGIAVTWGNAQGIWVVPSPETPAKTLLLYAAAAVSCAPIFLGSWWIAVKFGWRGLAVGLATLIGPPRDYLVAAVFPSWIQFSPGPTPVFADAVAYFTLVALGHSAMRLVAGAARDEDSSS